MMSKFITINSITDMTDFIHHAVMVDGDVICRKGKYTVDGKSIMGVMSIDISTGVTVEYPDDATDFNEFLNQFA